MKSPLDNHVKQPYIALGRAMCPSLGDYTFGPPYRVATRWDRKPRSGISLPLNHRRLRWLGRPQDPKSTGRGEPNLVKLYDHALNIRHPRRILGVEAEHG
jgi:hypothetical protein